MRWARASAGLAVTWAVSAAGAMTRAAEVSQPLDCFPDAVVTWQAAQPSPETRFGATSLPGIVLGPPGDSPATQGSTSVASLGNGGFAVVVFEDVVIEDGPGPDFIVFENPFFVGTAPQSEAEDYQIFAEPGFVEVSPDGVSWHAFPYDAQALAAALGANIDRAQVPQLVGLAGITPTFTGNWTVPDDPLVWDPSGVGGVSGAGGDAFDLATVGLAEARRVRITDAGSQNGPTGSAEGFDLDAIVILHGRPVTPAGPDLDGDRLPDLAEVALYGTDPGRGDSDFDGVDDGREVASCRDPNAIGDAPVFVREPRLSLVKAGGCTEARFTFLGTGVAYDLIRGDLGSVAQDGSEVDLGLATCVANDYPAVRGPCDSTVPPVGEAFFHLVRVAGEDHYGRSGALDPRRTASGCP